MEGAQGDSCYFSGPGVRMLGLDGGGSRGLVLALVVKELDERLNHKHFHGGIEPDTDSQVRIWQLFDVVIGKHTLATS